MLAAMGPYAPITLGYGAQYMPPNTVDFGGLSILTQLSGCFLKRWFSSARREGGVVTKSLFTGQLTTAALLHAEHPSDPMQMGPWSIASVPCVAASWVVYKKDGICLEAMNRAVKSAALSTRRGATQHNTTLHGMT